MLSMGTTTSLLTFEEFERLPDQPGKRELLKGELIDGPPAEEKHNTIRLPTAFAGGLRTASRNRTPGTKLKKSEKRASNWDISYPATVGCSPTLA